MIAGHWHKTALRGIAASAVAVVLGAPGHALTLQECDRTTHISHGGDSDHVDYGEGKVGWIGWWAQEGVFKEVWVADCATGRALSLRTWEERISDRYIVDRTDAARAVLADWAETGSAFFTLDWMADKVAKSGRDLMIKTYTTEFCGCAAAYPALRGDKTLYEEKS